MLFCFWDKELQDLSRDLAIFRQRFWLRFFHRSNRRSGRNRILVNRRFWFLRRYSFWQGFLGYSRSRSSSLKSKRITLLENADVFFRLHAVGADHDEIRFQQRHSFRNKLHQWSSSIGRDAGIHRVL